MASRWTPGALSHDFGGREPRDRPDLRRRVARGLIARAVWRPGVVAADLTIDVPSRVQADGSACRPGLPVRLGSVTIGTDDYRRRAA